MRKQLDERILCILQSDMVALEREKTWKQLKYAQNNYKSNQSPMQHIVVKYNKWDAYTQSLNTSFEYMYIMYCICVWLFTE